MEVEPFQRNLRETGAYDTPLAPVRSLANRLMGRFDAWYYFGILRIVLSARSAARQGRFDRPTWAYHSLWTIRLAESCGGKFHLSALRQPSGLPGPVVYVANHMSMLETFVLPVVLLAYGDVTTIVKEDLLHYPLFGVVMRAVEPVSVGREDPRADLREVLERGPEHIARGRSVLVFPQATRSAAFDPGLFNSLGVKLAQRAGVPVVPLALKTDFQGIGRLVKDFGPLDRSREVRIALGEPVPAGSRGREAHDKVVEFIRGRLTQWGGRVADDESTRHAGM